MHQNNSYFSISKYNEERNKEYSFDLTDFNADFSIENDDSINDNNYSSNQQINFDNLNPKINSYEDQIEQKFKTNFLKSNDGKDFSLLKQKRINESIIEENQDNEKIKIISEGEKIEQKPTRESTGEFIKIKNKIQNKLFEVNQKLYRNEYYIKKFKVECFSNFATNKLNYFLKSCEFPKRLNLNKIYMPNNKAFTSIANQKKNKAFLSIPIKDIFSMKNGEGQSQEKNALNFITIFNSRNEAGNIQAYDRLVEYLNMTMEEVIIDYYNSKEFENFITNEKIIEFDIEFYKEKKFSILKDFGFLRLIKGKY